MNKCAVCSMQCPVCSVQCTVCAVCTNPAHVTAIWMKSVASNFFLLRFAFAGKKCTVFLLSIEYIDICGSDRFFFGSIQSQIQKLTDFWNIFIQLIGFAFEASFFQGFFIWLIQRLCNEGSMNSNRSLESAFKLFMNWNSKFDDMHGRTILLLLILLFGVRLAPFFCDFRLWFTFCSHGLNLTIFSSIWVFLTFSHEILIRLK